MAKSNAPIRQLDRDFRWFSGEASYRALFDGFLGGDSSWQKVNLDVRTYVSLSRDRRHKIAFWAYTDLVVGGVAPFFDLPSTAGDTYGRSARGYAEGQSAAKSSPMERSNIEAR